MLARHSVLHELGRGATGAVYAARARTTGAVVALKRLDPALFDESGRSSTGRALEQLRAARHLRHRNIVHIDEAGEAAGTVYVAMEMLEGASLRRILDEGPIAVARAVQITHDIASGLAYAHLEAVVHARLKPSNIIILPSGLAKITDFGIGQLGHQTLLSGARAGCLRYLSPEQLRGDAIDHRCDLFSLGALLYEMLAQRAPFEGRSPKEITESILRGAPRPPSELNPHVPRALDSIVLSMLAVEPADRMAGAPVLLRELQRLEEALGLDLPATAASDEAPASAKTEAEPVLRMPDPADFDDREPRFEIRDQVIDRQMFDVHRAMMQRESGQRPSRLRPAMFAALGLVLGVLFVEVAGFVGLIDLPPLPKLTRLAGLPGIGGAMDSLPSRNHSAVAANPVQEAPVRGPLAPPLSAPATVPVTEVIHGVSPALEVREEKAEQESLGALSAQAAIQTARLIVSVSPRGDLYIDGKHHGTTPPIKTVDLTPGMHRIEVRSGSRRSYLTYMTVQAGEVRRIRYDFDARPVRPPR